MQRRTAEELRRLNRALRLLSACNKLLTQAGTEQELLDRVCRLIVDSGAYRFAWIGYAQPDERKTVLPVAHAGSDDGYLESIQVTWSETPSGRGPMGSAIRENRTVLIADTGQDPTFLPWRAPATHRGYLCVLALPLRAGDTAYGALGIYSELAGAFQKDEIELLEELAANLAYGIGAERAEEARNRALTDLQQAELKYRELVEQVPAIAYVGELGIEGRWHYVSPQIETILGFTPEEWTSHPEYWRAQMHPDDVAKVLAAEATLHNIGDRFSLAYRMRARDGREIWIRDEATYVRSQYAGGFVMRGLLLDITERKRAEEALERSEEKYRQFVSHSSEGILRTEYNPPVPVDLPMEEQLRLSLQNGYVAECNHALAAMYGYSSAAEMQGRRLTEIASIEDPDNYKFAAEFVRNGYRISHFPGQRISGGQRRLFYISMVGTVEDGKLTRTWGVQTDVTERVQLEEQIQRMQHLEAIGRLAGGIAHDFNNIVGIIIGHSDLLLDFPHSAERSTAGLKQIRSAAAKAASLTQQLLAFSRKQVLQPKILDLNETVLELQKMLARLIGEDIEIITKLDAELAPVKADPGQIHQVLMNLAVNARDAMPQGGKLVISSANVNLGDNFAGAHPGVRPGNYAMLSISDTGHGMDAETVSHIFEPFFTTKEIGKGTGLGLATVYGIIKQSGGHITVYSEPGYGSTFRIYLPAEAASAKKVAPALEAEINAAGNETILLVEDEPDLRDVARSFLTAYGYQVLAAEGTQDALKIAKEFSGPIHLLLTDVLMPKMSGREVAQHVLGMHPQIKVVYMTGYTDDIVVHHKVLEPGNSVLQKPFTRAELGAKVRAALDANAGTSRGQSAGAQEG